MMNCTVELAVGGAASFSKQKYESLHYANFVTSATSDDKVGTMQSRVSVEVIINESLKN